MMLVVGGFGDGDNLENIPACFSVLTELGQKHFSLYSSTLQLSFRRPDSRGRPQKPCASVPSVFQHRASWLMQCLSARAGCGWKFTVTDGVWRLQSSNNKRNENKPNLYVQLLSYDINKWSFSQKHICMKRFFSPFLYCYESSEAQDSLYVFHKGLRRMKTKTQKTARREKKLRVH